MENLTINDKVLAPKFNFAFSKEIEKRLASDQDTGFNNLVYGLLDEDPDTLIAAFYSAFASLTGMIRPTEDQIVDALTNDLVDDDKAHALFVGIVKEIVANGFLHLKLNKFKKSLTNIIEIGSERLNKLSNDGLNLTDQAAIDKNKEQVDQVTQGIDGIKKVAEDLEAMIQEATQAPADPNAAPMANA